MDIVTIAGVVITVVTGAPVLMQLLRDHPRGLFVLFFAEMWERFSYYGMRGLLVFYLTQQFLFRDAVANAQYGSYTTLVYLLPLIGGILADRYLGSRKAIAFGALLLVAGHLTMAFEGPPAQQILTYQGQSYHFDVQGRGDTRHVQLNVAGQDYDFGPAPDGGLAIKNLPAGSPLPASLAKGSYEMSVKEGPALYKDVLYLALALIIMGVGFLKANISSIVGQLYPQGDPRRDSGFTLYYYGVNLGAFWAAIACAGLGQKFGWSYGFGLAGIGMLAGYVIFVLGRRMLQGKGEPPDAAALARPIAGPLNLEWLIYLAAIPGLAVVWLLVQNNTVVGYCLGVGGLAALAYVVWHMVTKCDRIQRERLMLAFFLVFGSLVFFTLFEQAGTSLNLFADRNTQLGLMRSAWVVHPFGQEVFFGTPAMWDAAHPGVKPGLNFIDMSFTSAQTQTFNAGFILLLAPLFAWLWTTLGRHGRDPNPVAKFGFGLLNVGLGFLVIVWCAGLADGAFRLPLLVLVLTYFLHTVGELALSPVGLSQITKLAPPVLISTMMAIWFLAASWAQFIGAKIAALTASETAGGQVIDPGAALARSLGVFGVIGWVGIGFGVAFLIASPFLKRWAHGVNDTAPAQPAPDLPVADAAKV
jgi:POT family proton-dependent oligopeptide transporter